MKADNLKILNRKRYGTQPLPCLYAAGKDLHPLRQTHAAKDPNPALPLMNQGKERNSDELCPSAARILFSTLVGEGKRTTRVLRTLAAKDPNPTLPLMNQGKERNSDELYRSAAPSLFVAGEDPYLSPAPSLYLAGVVASDL
jgi:hypothetical protein